MHQFEKLKIWQNAMDIAEKVYSMCVEMPITEKYNLILQLKKSATSIPSNIAEGSGRNSNLEFLHFLSIANGSTYELITQLQICKRVGIITNDSVEPLINELTEISNMNFSLQKTIKKKLPNRHLNT